MPVRRATLSRVYRQRLHRASSEHLRKIETKMGLKQKIVDRSKQALLTPSVLRWVTDDRVMKATEGFMDARARVRDAWKVLLNGNELPNIDPALDENIGQSAPAVNKTNGHAANGHS